ncbi:PAS domain-containing hybrid sensor histidine kinase/response regulator [Amycolatopsis sp. A1MSW2902]|uniref:PAS domain-containing hybrid sensor histidine kinase/response regulator n=1 Tax=Amycolatopsis sp. A1MSW2902 TaxID=687413 RepID=UPI00307ED481
MDVSRRSNGVSTAAAELIELAVAPSLIVRHGPDGAEVVAASTAFSALLGRSVPAGTCLSELFPALPADALASGCGPREVSLVGAGGETPVLLRVDRLRSGELAGLVLVQLDVTASRSRADRALWESEQMMQAIADAVDALIYLKGADGRYLLINSSFEKATGVRREDVVGMTDDDIFGARLGRTYHANDRRVLDAARSMMFEELVPGDTIYLSTKFPLIGEDGKPYAVGGISTDITDRSHAEQAVRLARDEAERANAAKTEFLSRMSHELRTPLNSILGFGQLLELDLRGEQADRAHRIVQAGHHLLNLINEVLDITTTEHVGLDVEVEPVGAVEAFQEALVLVRPLAEARGITLARDFHGGLDTAVVANRRRLAQVLLNLLSNAVKYNRPDGMVTASFRAGEGRIRFLVTDTGRGLTAEEAERVFAPFERLDAGGTEVEGTGLGLTLSRTLVEAMGGTLGVERSKPGRGSVFFLELPIAPGVRPQHEAAETGPGEPLADLSSVHVLYIEDADANVELVRGVLERQRVAELTCARTGADGVALARVARPDIILLDLHLPDADGENVLARLRAQPETAAIPVVVVSADALGPRITRLTEAGAAAYLTKPVDLRALVRTISELTSESRG